MLAGRLPRTLTPAHFSLDELIERALEQRAQVSARQRMTEQFARSLELLAKFPARRKLDAIARRRQRLRSAAEFNPARSGAGNDDAACSKPGDRSNPLCHVRP